ncbi:hypothetical protein GLOIN_2v1481254 [Rhizophagus clarus]|nr:hypothetical protein GLOIN_2v1481254 [Rhizophagus clarus]
MYLQHSENKDNLLPISPYASFVGKIYETVEQSDNDCKFGIILSEYNNFSFGNKAKTDFKIQVVYEAGSDSRFKKLAPKLSIGRLVYISGFFDLNENEFPFIEAKEIDLLDDYSNNSTQNRANITPQPSFSRANKFKNNIKYATQRSVEDTRTSSNIKITDDDEQTKNVNTENEDEVVIISTSTSGVNNKATKKMKKGNKIIDDDEQTKNINTENEDEVVITSPSTSGANDKATKKKQKKAIREKNWQIYPYNV